MQFEVLYEKSLLTEVLKDEIGSINASSVKKTYEVILLLFPNQINPLTIFFCETEITI